MVKRVVGLPDEEEMWGRGVGEGVREAWHACYYHCRLCVLTLCFGLDSKGHSETDQRPHEEEAGRPGNSGDDVEEGRGPIGLKSLGLKQQPVAQ